MTDLNKTGVFHKTNWADGIWRERIHEKLDMQEKNKNKRCKNVTLMWKEVLKKTQHSSR